MICFRDMIRRRYNSIEMEFYNTYLNRLKQLWKSTPGCTKLLRKYNQENRSIKKIYYYWLSNIRYNKSH